MLKTNSALKDGSSSGFSVLGLQANSVIAWDSRERAVKEITLSDGLVRDYTIPTNEGLTLEEWIRDKRDVYGDDVVESYSNCSIGNWKPAPLEYYKYKAAEHNANLGNARRNQPPKLTAREVLNSSLERFVMKLLDVSFDKKRLNQTLIQAGYPTIVKTRQGLLTLFTIETTLEDWCQGVTT